MISTRKQFFTNSLQYRNTNIANFVLAKRSGNSQIFGLIQSLHTYRYLIVQTKKKTPNIWKYKVGNNANIANFVCSWKTQMNVTYLKIILGLYYINSRRCGACLETETKAARSFNSTKKQCRKQHVEIKRETKRQDPFCHRPSTSGVLQRRQRAVQSLTSAIRYPKVETKTVRS